MNELGELTNTFVFCCKVLIQAILWEDWGSVQFVSCSSSSGPHSNCHKSHQEWYNRFPAGSLIQLLLNQTQTGGINHFVGLSEPTFTYYLLTDTRDTTLK